MRKLLIWLAVALIVFPATARGATTTTPSVNKDKRRVEVDLGTQRLYYYLNNVRQGSMPISSGILKMPTPQGTFKVLRKVPIIDYIGPGYNLPNTKWNLEFKPHFFLHGAYWHNQFGKKPMSHGCVNIAYKNAERLYDFLQVGDEVRIFGQTPTRPLPQVVLDI